MIGPANKATLPTVEALAGRSNLVVAHSKTKRVYQTREPSTKGLIGCMRTHFRNRPTAFEEVMIARVKVPPVKSESEPPP